MSIYTDEDYEKKRAEVRLTRLTPKQKAGWIDLLLEALAFLELAMSKYPWINKAPVFMPHGGPEFGALMPTGDVLKPERVDETIFRLDPREVGPQIIQICMDQKAGTGYRGIARTLLLPRKTKRFKMVQFEVLWPTRSTVKWLNNDGPGLADTSTRNQMIVTAALQHAREKNASIFFGLDRAAVEVMVDVSTVRRLLSDREKKSVYATRRSALKHFVDHFYRGPSREDDRVWVRKHLRGATEFEWGGFDILVRVPKSWESENTYWKGARDAYSKLPPEERAAWRKCIIDTFKAPMVPH